MILDITVESNLFTKRGHNQAMNRVHRELLQHHRETNWPLHFSPAAFFRYPDVFQPRGFKYSVMKQRRYGHQIPNVYSGELMEEVLNNSKITATAKSGRLTARGTFPLTAQRRAELEAVNEPEIQALSRRGGRIYLELSKLPEFEDRIRQRIR